MPGNMGSKHAVHASRCVGLFTETHPVARKEGGTTVRAKSPWQGGADLFEYWDSDVTCEFVANRFTDDRKLTDTYQLFGLPGTLSPVKAREVVEDIRAALLLMPPWLRRHGGRSPAAVNFNWKYWESVRLRASALRPVQPTSR